MDETTFQHSLDPQQTEFEFSNRQFTWLPDSNNSSYANGQVVFDCASYFLLGSVYPKDRQVVQLGRRHLQIAGIP